MSELVQKAYPRLRSTWWTGHDFLQMAEKHGADLAFFYEPTGGGALPAVLQPGMVVRVCLQFLDRNLEFTLHARIVERVAHGERHGLQLRCVAEERGRQEQVLDCAAGKQVPAEQRRSERIGCFFPVRAALPGQPPRPTWALNISQHGVFIAWPQPMPENTTLGLELDLPDQAPGFAISARVKMAVTESLQPGLGMEFLFESAEQLAAMRAAVEGLKRTNQGQGEIQLLDDLALNLTLADKP